MDWGVIAASGPALLEGALVTLRITVLGLAGGLALGVMVGLMRSYAPKYVGLVAFGYVEAIRGTPIVVQVMFIYFALPVLLGLRLDPIVAAYIAIIINSSAYIAEVVRGAFQSVAAGLVEAGLAVGLPMWKVLRYVTGPIAFRRSIPAMGNQFIVSLKDTSLFIVIGVGELTRTGQEIMATNFKAVEIWTAVAVLYLIMTGSLSWLLRFTERRVKML